jgi:quercetin dioxygenase-like cupin family protein
MSRFGNRVRVVAVGMACGAAGLAAGVYAGAAGPMVVVPASEARFAPVDPARPDAAQMAVLWGDPQTGPSAVLLKFKKSNGPLHVHSSDYHLVVLQGTMKHWAEGQEAAARALEPGSFWFQPGNQAHGDACLSDECLMYVQWAGKRDGRLAGAGATR